MECKMEKLKFSEFHGIEIDDVYIVLKGRNFGSKESKAQFAI